MTSSSVEQSVHAYQIVHQRHAIERIAQRGIREEDVEHLLLAGETIKEKAMKCVICKQGETQSGTTTMTLEKDTTTVIFKKVPTEVCETCSEAYPDAATTRHLLHVVEEAARAGVQVDVRSYAA